MLEAAKPVWKDLNDFYGDFEWEKLFEDRSASSITDLLIDKIEEAVVSMCGSLSKANKPTKHSQGCVFLSKNIIPKEVRTLFKKKACIFKALNKVKTVPRCVKLRARMSEIDTKLKKS